MTATQRREALLARIGRAREPVTGSQLAAEYGVSRQVIVQDMTVLRAQGAAIVATAQGYLMPGPSQACVMAVCCRHQGPEETRAELYAVVDEGGFIRDVVIEHAVYGELVGRMMVGNRRQVDAFLDKLYAKGTLPLSSITGGVHYHTIEAPDEATLEAVRAALRRAGVLVEEPAETGDE